MKTVTSFKIEPQQKEYLCSLSESLNISMSEVIRQGIELFIEQYREKTH